MPSPLDFQAFIPRAERYFSRSSFTEPVFIGPDTLAFKDDRSGTPQVSIVSLSSGETTPLTAYADRVMTLKGSAASGRIVFGKDRHGDERQQVWVFPSLSAEPLRLTHAATSIHEPGPLSKAGDYVVFRSNARDASTFDLVGIPLEGGEQETWLEAGGQVTPLDLAPDGQRLLVVRVNGNLDSDLLLVSRTGEVANLTPHTGEQWIQGAAFDRDGAGVYLLTNRDREFAALLHRDLATGAERVVYEAAWDVELFKVSPDGKLIALAVNEGGASAGRIIETSRGGQGHPGVRLEAPVGVIDGFSWSPDSTRVAFGISTVEHPSVIMLAGLDGRSRVVADAGAGIEPPKTFPAQAIRYPSFDGRDIPGFFFKPDGPGRGPFPAIVEIHGGPEAQRRLNYAPSGPVIQYLASLGIAVLALNVRGSTGYGKAYTHLDDKHRRLDAVEDVEYAVKWLHQRPDIDPTRIAVYGRSYGGFMALASLAFHPDLWAAGVEMVGIANFVSFLERTGPWRRKEREAEYGELEHDRDLLERISPLNHIDHIRAPLMVCHGRQDPRVPLYEAEQVVDAVRRRGRDVLLRVYDDEGHALSKRPNVLDAFAHMGAFLTRHLKLE